MKKVLVIGKNGMLGRKLLQILKNQFQCVGTDSKELNITVYNNTFQKIQKINPQIVINTAGFTQVDLCEEETEQAFAVNAEGAKHVALACNKVRAKCVYISTDYVFDGGKEEPYTEEDPTNPLSIYGKSKLKGENYVRENASNFLIIRTSWLFGEEGSNFVSKVIALSQEKKALEMVNDQKGSPTYTEDLSRAISLLIAKDESGVFHISNSGFCTWFDFAKKILEITGSSLKLIPVSSDRIGRPAERPPFSVLSCEKLKKETGIIMPDWEDALVRCIERMKRLGSAVSVL